MFPRLVKTLKQPRRTIPIGSSRHSSLTESSWSTPMIARRFSSDTRIKNESMNSSNISLSKVLIANRGEIACRVIRTCRRLGIPTVALYSVADGAYALHAQMADEAYQIGHGPSPTESYLLLDEIARIAQQVGAEAIHPGYGFLSEKAGFAQKITDSGMKFIGPPASAIKAMGSKSESKAIMEAAGVPVTPGYFEVTGDNETNQTTPQDSELLRGKAVEIGFPVLIKAVMGGGGKGMRIAWEESDFFDMLAACQREAKAAFGDDSVLLEKYLVRPRHIEVQIIADTHGNVVSLHERDCSLQRRHQKIIEEAPAPDLDPYLREEFSSMGRRAAEAVGYVNAGTVEFLLDTQHAKGSSHSPFFFCEMNTRLQVEHPVTEAITGVDLVEWQLRVAAGEQLPITDSSLIPRGGHSFEARIYAEQPTRNFLPSTGKVWYHSPPVSAINENLDELGVRVDSSIQAGHDVTVHYDPMISKLIVHGPDRGRALDQLIQALKQYKVAGVSTNIDFLIECARHEAFRQGSINTGFLEDFGEDLSIQANKDADMLALQEAISAFACLLHLEDRQGAISGSVAPWSSLQGSWRMGGPQNRALRVLRTADGKTIECVCNRDGSYEMTVEDPDGRQNRSFHIQGKYLNSSELEVVVDGSRRISMTCILRTQDGLVDIRAWPQNLPRCHSWDSTLHNPYEWAPEGSSVDSEVSSEYAQVKAPMPGKIIKVNYQPGDYVEKGATVIVMEAMKMEQPIVTPIDGVLMSLGCAEGRIVDDNSVLFDMGPAEDSTDTGS